MKNLLRLLASQDDDEGALGRHGVMLLALVLLLVALPLGHAVAGGQLRFSLLFGLVLMSAVFVNRRHRFLFVLAAIIAVGSIVGTGYAAYFESDSVRIFSLLLGLLLLCLTTLVMFNGLLLIDHVSQDTVIGGICVYLLIGLCFAVVFILMTDLSPGVFAQGGVGLIRSPVDPSAHATTLLYFSFVTLTTLGYGDVSPVGEMGRMFAVSEAVIGQLYLAIFVARLVALYVVSARRS